MSWTDEISFNDQWRAQALAQIERDPTVIDRLIRLYPAWEEIVVSVLTAVETRPIRPHSLAFLTDPMSLIQLVAQLARRARPRQRPATTRARRSRRIDLKA
jgi:hypothetical protein